MGKLKKPILVVGIVLVAISIAAAVYLLVIKKDKAQNSDSTNQDKASSQQAVSVTNPEEELKAAGDTYTDANAPKILNAAELYSTKRDFEKVKNTLSKIPDTAAISVLGSKYRILTSMYLTQSNQDMYLKTKAEYKAILTTRSAKDAQAKTALASIDKIFPENTAPSVTYPEGQEQP